MESLEDRVTRLEVTAKTTEDELDRINARLENSIGETRFRFDRVDTNIAALSKKLRDMDTKLDLLDTRLTEQMGLLETRLTGQMDLLDTRLTAQLDAHSARLGAIDTRLGGIDTRLGGIDKRFDGVERTLAEILAQLTR